MSDPVAGHRLASLDAVAGDLVAEGLLGDLDGRGLRFGIACARFNAEVTMRLLDGARRSFTGHGVAPGDLIVAFVPGAFELPLAAARLLGSDRLDGVVCLGAVIRGETSHFDFVAGECAAGCQRVQLDTGAPVIFGVLTTDDLDQAIERSGGHVGDKGAEAATSAIEMARLLERLGTTPRERLGSAAGAPDLASRAPAPR